MLSIVAYLLGGGAQLEVALDIRVMKICYLAMYNSLPSGRGRTAGGGTG